MGRSVKVSTRPLWMLLRLESTSTNKGLFMTCSGFTESREQMLLNGGAVRPANHPPAAREKLLANCRRLHRGINVVRIAQTEEREQRPVASSGPKDSHADLSILRHPSGKICAV